MQDGCDQTRAVFVYHGRNVKECHRELVQDFGNNSLSYQTITRWVAEFQQGHEATSDQQWSGQPVSVLTDISCAAIDPNILFILCPFICIFQIFHLILLTKFKSGSGTSAT